MGVHSDPEVYAEVKKLLVIPEDEPIFILRAKDKLAEDAIDQYLKDYIDEVAGGKRHKLTVEQRKFVDQLYAVMDEMYDWKNDHTDKVKIPD